MPGLALPRDELIRRLPKAESIAAAGFEHSLLPLESRQAWLAAQREVAASGAASL